MNILSELGLPKSKVKEYQKSLKKYKYIDDLNKLKIGSYIRWIDKGVLKKGMFLCDIVIGDNGVYLKGKVFQYMINLNIEDCILFQKLSNDETVILSAINLVDSNYIL